MLGYRKHKGILVHLPSELFDILLNQLAVVITQNHETMHAIFQYHDQSQKPHNLSTFGFLPHR